jgi:surfeit locus 1 family protein
VTRRLAAFVALAAALGALFVRLGIWQLERRSERRAANESVSRGLRLPAAAFETLAADSSARNRRVTVSGAPDYANEIIVTGKSRNGSPGVHIFTPLRVAGHDTAVLINRGWVYSPDAATVDLHRWREPRSTFSGFTQLLPATSAGATSRDRHVSGAPALRVPSATALARLLPYPVHSLYVVAQDSAIGDSVPVRLSPPVLSDGPHLSYAIQWFAFAAIALIGAGAVVRRVRRATSGGAQLAEADR